MTTTTSPGSSSRSASGRRPTSPTRTSWTELFDDAELAELDAALRHALAKSDDVLELGRDDFPLPTLHDRLLRHRGRADRRPRLRAAPRHRPRRLHPGRDGDPLLGHRHAPRPAVGAEQARPRARRRHRPGQGDRRPDRAGQRARRRRAAVPLRRLRPRRPACASRTAAPAACRRSPTRCASTTGSSPSGPTSPPRSTTSCRTTSAASRPPGGKPLLHRCRCSPSGTDRLFVRCIPPYICASQRHPDAPRLTDVQIEALRRVVRDGRRPRPTTCSWSCGPATCSSSTTTTCSTAARRTRTTASAGQIRHLKRLWLETTVLTEPPAVLRQPQQPLARQPLDQPPHPDLTAVDPSEYVGASPSTACGPGPHPVLGRHADTRMGLTGVSRT